MEANQKILYENFKKVAVDGKTQKLRDDCEKAAAEILKSFPQFEVKEKVEKKPISKEVKEKK